MVGPILKYHSIIGYEYFYVVLHEHQRISPNNGLVGIEENLFL